MSGCSVKTESTITPDAFAAEMSGEPDIPAFSCKFQTESAPSEAER